MAENLQGEIIEPHLSMDPSDYSDEPPISYVSQQVGEFSSINNHLVLGVSYKKYFRLPSDPDHVEFNLNDSHVVPYCRDSYDGPLEDMLQWMEANRDELPEDETFFVIRRGLLKKIAEALYNYSFCVAAIRLNRAIFLTDFSYNGGDSANAGVRTYQFRSFLVSDRPDTQPQRTLNMNEEFHKVFTGKLSGQHKLLISARMDALDPETGKDVRLSLVEGYKLRDPGTADFRARRCQLPKLCLLAKFGQGEVCYNGETGTGREADVVKCLRELNVADMPERVDTLDDGFRINRSLGFLTEFLTSVKETVGQDENHVYNFQWEPPKQWTDRIASSVTVRHNPDSPRPLDILPLWFRNAGVL